MRRRGGCQRRRAEYLRRSGSAEAVSMHAASIPPPLDRDGLDHVQLKLPHQPLPLWEPEGLGVDEVISGSEMDAALADAVEVDTY